MTQLPPHTMSELHTLLTKMDACARELEVVTNAEHDAIRMLDGDQIMALTDRRITVHQCLATLEQDGRTLRIRAGIPDDMTLEVLIDVFAGNQAGEFQALRRNLYDRMIHIDQQSQENSMRLRAAYNVSSTLLQHLGLVQQKQVYDRTATR
ncbi:flagellar export chaperone FlgN [Mariprofundus ferrooxydans]|uniref:flagellar export chaperone FlgN n=1 Tax=Mariprofundus ferrooxydans TaxID=314344 RepID=UPI001E4FBD6A|nr:flagellar export chaperone FlgN [Mariprofundus ferrooxydans]